MKVLYRYDNVTITCGYILPRHQQKMNHMKKIVSLILASVVFFGCSALEPYIKQEADSTENKENKENTESEDSHITYKMHGVAQKGQLIRGSLVTAFGLSSEMEATDECFHSQVTDDMGSFVISSKTSASYLELNVNGYYFVENTGELSEGPIYLQAIVPNGTEDFSINVLTTIITPRVKYLISKGKSYEDAVAQAQDEFMQAIGYKGQEYMPFSDMNIAGASYSDAILLAASCIVQENRSTNEVQSIITDLASALEKNGSLPHELVEQLFKHADEVDIWYVTENIVEYYKNKSIEDYNLPPFYVILDESYAKGVHFVDEYSINFPDYSDCNVHKDGTTGSQIVLCTENFNVISDCNWIKVEKSHLIADFYEITYTVEANKNNIRSGNIQYTIGSEVVAESYFKQQGAGVKLYIALPYSGTKSLVETESKKELQEGEEVNVNGKIYSLLKDDLGCYVQILEQAPMYSVCYPVSAEYTDLNGNKVSFTPVQNSEYNDCYYCTVTYPTTGYSDNVRPYYGLIQGAENHDMMRVKLTPCYMGLKFDFTNTEIKNKTITISTDQNIFGKFTYSPHMSQSELYLNPNAILREPLVSSGTNKAVVKLDENYSSKVLFVAPRNFNFQEFGLVFDKLTIDFDYTVNDKSMTKSLEVTNIGSLLEREGYILNIRAQVNEYGAETIEMVIFKDEGNGAKNSW